MLLSHSHFIHRPTIELFTLPLHDALPISDGPYDAYEVILRKGGEAIYQVRCEGHRYLMGHYYLTRVAEAFRNVASLRRSEEHTSELQSPCNLVCRLLLETKKLIPSTAVLVSL